MKKFKRIIALVTVAMFLLSVAAPSAFAADADDAADKVAIGEDVKGTKYETPAVKLMALDIIKGFEDGTIRPESDVTRAQFAVIVAKMLNLGDVSPSPTKFSDVPADHWASGAINLATGRGIIVGYPDGTFKPEQNVTYAEACAMLMQTLGYGPALKEGTWPSTPLSLAASAGVTQGVRLAANDKTPRGEVLMMAANALEADIMEQDVWGSEAEWKKRTDEKTLLTEIFDIDVKDLDYDKEATPWNDQMPVVKETPRFDLGNLEPNEIRFGTTGNGELAGSDYEVVELFDPNKFMAQEVEVWVDRDDLKIYYIGNSNEQTVYYDEIDSWDVANNEVKLDKLDEEYDINNDAAIYINTKKFGKWENLKDNDDMLADTKGDPVKVVLDDNGDVEALVIDNYYTNETGYDTMSGFVSEIDDEDEVIRYYDKGGDEATLDLDDADYAIIKNGVQVELEDLEADDVLNIMDDGGDYYIVVTDNKVSGEVEKTVASAMGDISNWDVFIDGKKYDVSPECTFSDDDNDTIDAADEDDLEDLAGKEATLYIDAQGDIKHIVTGDETESSSLYGVIVKTPEIDGPYEEVKLTMVGKDGVEVDYKFDYDDVDIDGVEPDEKADWRNALNVYDAENHIIFVKYELDSAGNLDEIKIKSDDEPEWKKMTADDVVIDAENDESVTFDDGSSYNITDKTVIFDATGWDGSEIDDIKVISWDALDNKEVKYYGWTDGADVDYLVVYDSTTTLGSGENYGVITGFTKVDGDDAIEVLMDDGTKQVFAYDDADYASDEAAITGIVYGETHNDTNFGLKKGQFIYFTLTADGDNQEIDEIAVLAFKEKMTTAGTGLGDIEVDSIRTVKVANSSSTYIKGEEYDTNTGTYRSVAYYTVNSDTTYFEIFDTGALKKANNVSKDDIVVLIDTDDDGSAYDYVVVVHEG